VWSRDNVVNGYGVTSDGVLYPARTPPSLVALLMRRKSLFHIAFGLTNGRPHAVSALDNLYPHKYADTVLKLVRQVHKAPAVNSVVWDLVDRTLDVLYHHMGTSHHFGKLKIPVTLDDTQGMPLGTSAGLNRGHTRKFERPEGTYYVNPSGKKYEILRSDFNAFIEFICGDDVPPPAVFWKILPKNEIFHSFVKQLDDEEWEKFLSKLRLFVIPSSIFVLFERCASKVRFHLERGKVIQIGHKWPHGGADRLLEVLGLTFAQIRLPVLVESDVKNFDQGVWERLVNLYHSMGMIYDDPKSPDYETRKKIHYYIIRAVLVRMTHLFGPVWGVQTGGVPSGKLNTSHCDSWIMAFWIFNYFVYQIHTAKDEHKELLEFAMLDIVRAIVYGDDNAWNKTSDPVVSSYFSGAGFVRFMRLFYDVEVRDLKDGVSFISDTSGGSIVRMGLTFLRHQFVLNPLRHRPDQCQLLPYRETREFVVRAAWGHEARVRTPLDVMLSVMGHAYGTYASNPDAWLALKWIYYSALEASGLKELEAVSAISDSLRGPDLKDIRRRGMTKEDILLGFPSWEMLVKKNSVLPGYHDLDANLSAVDFSEYEMF